MTPEHFAEWWGYGVFFLLAALAQAVLAVLLVWWPARPVLLVGILGNLFIMSLYVVTRTIGIPLVGPSAGEVEGVGLIDAASKVTEGFLVLLLTSLWLGRQHGAPQGGKERVRGSEEFLPPPRLGTASVDEIRVPLGGSFPATPSILRA